MHPCSSEFHRQAFAFLGVAGNHSPDPARGERDFRPGFQIGIQVEFLFRFRIFQILFCSDNGISIFNPDSRPVHALQACVQVRWILEMLSGQDLGQVGARLGLHLQGRRRKCSQTSLRKNTLPI